MKRLTTGYRTDKQKLKRFNEIKEYFTNKDNRYIQFDGYCLSLQYHSKSSGLRWFHCDKYLVEVVVDRPDGPSQNIAPWVLLSSFDDAILVLTLTEEKAVEMLRKDKELINQ